MLECNKFFTEDTPPRQKNVSYRVFTVLSAVRSESCRDGERLLW